ncbi:MAG: RluA family pseudouridine synthase [Burkholderiales bacterium]|nr:RluA family pseudouridine synthase [Burkholderiales bacterium]
MLGRVTTSTPRPLLIHVDDALIVADKPAGLLAVPGRAPERADCLSAWVQALHADALVVHRLDMATSGLIVFGRGADMQRRLSIAFAERRVRKAYLAVVDGLVAEDAGSIDLPLIADWPNRPRQIVDLVHGKPSLTHWRLLGRDVARQRSRLALTPVTGRSHQLRVHLAAIGHPILGDDLYASPEAAAASDRLLLHANGLALDHPATGVAMAWESIAPF